MSRQDPVCGCSGALCGVMQDYGQMWQSWSAKYVDGRTFTQFDARQSHVKWKALGKAASKPGWK